MKNKSVVTLTSRAEERIKFLLASRASPAIGIKINVKSGGCSGLKYEIMFAEEVGRYDEVVEINGVKLVVDSKAVLYLLGSEMDYIEEKMKSGFIFSNPNQKGSCGCGESFHI
jgi:iron-sulfur cluster assembly protein